VGMDQHDRESEDPPMECTLCEWHDHVSIDDHNEYISSLLKDMLGDANGHMYKYPLTVQHHAIMDYNSLDSYAKCRCIDLCTISRDIKAARDHNLTCSATNRATSWCWPKSSTGFRQYAVDWVQGTLGHATIVSGPDFQGRFFPCNALCSTACTTLMNSRNEVKRMMKHSRNGS
jgi:hypothetical protein